MEQNLKNKLKYLNIEVKLPADFNDGIKLSKLVLFKLYNNNNQELAARLKTTNLHQTANCIININILLKDLRNKPECPQDIKALSAFNLLENPKSMLKLVNWLVQLPNPDIQQAHEMAEAEQEFEQSYKKEDNKPSEKSEQGVDENDNQGNQLENFYFASELQNNELNKEEEPYQPMSEEIVRPGGNIKIFKPKTAFNSYIEQGSPAGRDSLQKFQARKQEQPIRPEKNNFLPKPYDNPPAPTRFIDPTKIKSKAKDMNMISNNTSIQSQNHSKHFEQQPSSIKKYTRQIQGNYRKNSSGSINIQNDSHQTLNPSYNASYLKPPESKKNTVTYHQPPTSSNQTSDRIIKNKINLELKSETLSNHSSHKSAKIEKIEKQVNLLDKEIEEEERSLQKEIKKSTRSLRSLKDSVKSDKAHNNSNMKIDLQQVNKPMRKEIVQWLISINLLNNLAIKNFENLHVICRNGLIFPEIVNYKKGREAQLKYERNPRNATEIQSNYKRLFTYLKQLNHFHSDLLFRYEYFVPEVTQKPFWVLLLQIYTYYTTGKQKRKTSMSNNPAQQFMTSSVPPVPIPHDKNPKQSQRTYNKIKFGFEKGNSSSKKKLNPHQSRSLTKIQTQSSDDYEGKIKTTHGRQNNQNKNNINIEIPNDQMAINKSSILESPQMGYYQVYLKRLETPKRRESINNTSHNSSMSRSRVSLKNTSAKKRQEIPQITLEMELASLKYLKQNGYPLKMPKPFQSRQLFEDPLRNGTLLMLIVSKHFHVKSEFWTKPKSIQQCRDNYKMAFKIIKTNMHHFPSNLLQLAQQIIKGQKNIFYGILYHLIQDKKTLANYKPDQSFDKKYYESTKTSSPDKILRWLDDIIISSPESIKHSNINIRTWNQLIENIKNGLLLIELARLLTKKPVKAVYEKPQYHTHYEANLNKALTVLAECKIINTSYVWKIKKIMEGDQQLIISLLSDIKKIHSPSESNTTNLNKPSISFNHLLRNNYNTLNTTFDNNNKPLETTMTNNMYSTNNNFTQRKDNQESELQQHEVEPKEQQIEIDWMKKIGFACAHNINNGVILCRLIEKLTMKSMEGINYNPQTKGQMLLNIRKVLKEFQQLPNSKILEFVDETYIFEADENATRRLYKSLKQAFKNSYVFKPQTNNNKGKLIRKL